MLAQRLGRWSIIKTASDKGIVFAGIVSYNPVIAYIVTVEPHLNNSSDCISDCITIGPSQ